VPRAARCASASVTQITPFSTNNVNIQGTNTLVGNYVGWTTIVEPGCASGWRYFSQSYTGGTYASGCGTSNGDRSAVIYYQCGPAGTVASLQIIQESPACNVGVADILAMKPPYLRTPATPPDERLDHFL
jgi:hypothetical protein